MRVPSDQEVLTEASAAERDEAASRRTPTLKREHNMAACLEFNTQSIPQELRAAKAWVLWKEEPVLADDGKPETDPDTGRPKMTKKPYRADDPSRLASTTDPSTWAYFDAAVAAAQGDCGIGVVVGGVAEDLVGGDIDGCRDPKTGEVEPWAMEWIKALGTYTEVSPSGTGVRFFAFGKWPSSKHKTPAKDSDGKPLPKHPSGKKREFEVYDKESPRYLTVTGRHLDGTPTTINRRDEALAALAAFLFPNTESSQAVGTLGSGHEQLVVPKGTPPQPRLDDLIASDPKFASTWNHDRDDLGDDWSRYDSAIAVRLLLEGWTAQEAAEAIAAFHDKHGHKPRKARRLDYLQATIEDAEEKVAEIRAQSSTGRRCAPGLVIASGGVELMIEPVPSDGRAKARVTAMRDGVPVHMDTVTLDSSTSRKRFTNAICKLEPDVDQAELDTQLIRVGRELLDQPDASAPEQPEKPVIDPADREAAMEMLGSPTVFKIIAEDIEHLGVAGEQDTAVVVYVVATSRILSDPLGLVMQGPTSAGKTHVVKKVALLVPEDSKLDATNLSEHAWYYFEHEEYLRHRVVIVGERKQSTSPEAADEGRALRQLLTEKQLTRVVVLRDPNSGQFVSTPVTVRGPIAYVETTTMEQLLDEDASRLLPVRPDESKEQTEKVMARLAGDAEGKALPAEDGDAIIRKHHAAQLLLEEFTDCSVLIPYASAITLPTDKVIARRLYGFVLSMIRAVALIRVFQKPEADRDPIVADIEDYRIAQRLMAPVVQRQLAPLSDGGEDLFKRLSASGKAAFKSKDAAALQGVSARHARRRLRELLANDLIEETEDSKRNSKEYRLKLGASPDRTPYSLPDPEEVEERYAIQHEDNEE